MLDSSTYYQLRFYTYLSTTALASGAPLLDIYIYIYITKLSPQVCWLNEFFFVNPRREYSRSSIGSVGNAAQLLNFHHSFSFPLASFHIQKLLLVQEKKIEPKLKNYGHSNKCSPYIIYVSEFGCEYINFTCWLSKDQSSKIHFSCWFSVYKRPPGDPLNGCWLL